jgi:hypothetical protein
MNNSVEKMAGKLEFDSCQRKGVSLHWNTIFKQVWGVPSLSIAYAKLFQKGSEGQKHETDS